MRILLIVALFFISSWAGAQIKTQTLAKTAIPKSIRYAGKPVQVLQYQDQTGTYLAFTTETGEQPQKGDTEFKQAHLYAYVYQLKTNAAPVLLWQLHDLVTDCNLDMIAAFVPGALTVTDVDKNGKAEVWTTYRLSCRGDVSPSDLKMIMHEGAAKYARRGVGKIKVGNKIEPDGGKITSDDFVKTAPSIKEYAGKLWNKYLVEKM